MLHKILINDLPIISMFPGNLFQGNAVSAGGKLTMSGVVFQHGESIARAVTNLRKVGKLQ